MRFAWAGAAVLTLAACDTYSDPIGPPAGILPPAQLYYQLEPIGTGTAPSGLILSWPDDGNPNLAVWHVYSRGSTAESYGLRGTTTSNTFHDNGPPDLQYYVTAEDLYGVESVPGPVVTIDERLALPAPANLLSTSLDGAIALYWTDNAHAASPARFAAYRIYSAAYDLDSGFCDEAWYLEGTTVAPEFIAGALPNGQPRCFAVTAQSVEGYESLWSPIRADTPRPDARNVVLHAIEATPAQSGFRFWKDLNFDGFVQPAELGLIGPGAAADIDFVVERNGAGGLRFRPVRAGTGVEFYGTGPVGDLTDVDWAPNQLYSPAPIDALVGWGYVFEMNGGDGFARYGAVRVTHVGQDFLILDWSYQTDPGNPELIRGGGVRVAPPMGHTVAR
ncbi:MAG TPA: hypothetical protein VFV65_01740 [Gemmatimonadales bacterium]|nr:hypothetical protein [Gemmatimonadales bacterium]